MLIIPLRNLVGYSYIGSQRVGHDRSDLAPQDSSMLSQVAQLHLFVTRSYTQWNIYIHHNFIHASADGHVGCFHILATVNEILQ